jgi:hypothetical protein
MVAGKIAMEMKFCRRMLDCNKIQYPGIYEADYHEELRRDILEQLMTHQLDTLDLSQRNYMGTYSLLKSAVTRCPVNINYKFVLEI